VCDAAPNLISLLLSHGANKALGTKWQQYNHST